MGGSSSSKTVAGSQANQVTQPAQYAQMTTMGSGVDPGVLQQLSAAGYGGLLSGASAFSPVSVPMLITPADYEAYLRSKGGTPVSPAAATGSSGSSGSSNTSNREQVKKTDEPISDEQRYGRYR